MALRRSLRSAASASVMLTRKNGRLAPGYAGRENLNTGRGMQGRHYHRVMMPPAQSVRRSGARSFSVLESVQNKIINRSMAKQENEFRDNMRDLSLMEKFDLDDFGDIIAKPLNKMSAKLPWNKDREELKNVKMQKAIVDSLTPAQRKNPDMIRAGHRQSIADRAGCTLEDVNLAFAAYREMRAMHAWLSTRRKRRERIPRTQEEMNIMASDPSGTQLIKFMRVRKGGTGQRTKFGF